MSHNKKDIAKLIGRPFVPSGIEGMKRYDCYSCARDVYKTYDIKLAEHFLVDTYDEINVNKQIDYEANSKWERIEVPVEPCIVTFKFNSKFVNHVGVYIGDGKFIHNRERMGVNIDRIDSPAWRHRIEGFYIYKGNKNNDSSQ
jgi:cell wall-associated NlpC family hydrolase